MASRSSWSHYAKIDSDNTKVTGTSTSVVVEIDASQFDSTWWGAVKADGSDIIIVPSGDTTDANKYARELVGFDTGTSTGIIHFGPVSLTSASSTSFDVWVGNASASELVDLVTLWAGFNYVYHLEESSSPYVNATNPGTGDLSAGASHTSTGAVPGKVGVGQEFSSVNDDYIQDSPSDPIHRISAPYTFSAWIYIKGNGVSYNGWMTPVGLADDKDIGQYRFMVNINTSPHYMRLQVKDSSGNSVVAQTTTFPTLTWIQLVGVVTDSLVELYVDGTQVASATPPATIGTISNTDPFSIGASNFGVASTYRYPFNGIVDEVRMYSGSASPDQIATMYESQNNPALFWTYNSTTALGGGSTVDQLDSFEDGNYTTNPTWVNYSTGSNSWSVVSGGTVSGTYSIQATGSVSGDESILTYTLASSESAPASGDSWYTSAYFSDAAGTKDRNMAYRISDGTNYVEVNLNAARNTLTVTDGTNNDTAAVSLSYSIGVLKLSLNFGASNVTGAIYDNTGTLVSETSIGITNPLTGVSSVRVSSLNATSSPAMKVQFDQVKYGTGGTAPGVSYNAPFFGGGL